MRWLIYAALFALGCAFIVLGQRVKRIDAAPLSLKKGETYILRTFPDGGLQIEKAPDGYREPVRVMAVESYPVRTAYPTCDERSEP